MPGSLKVLKKGGRLIAISAQPDQEEAKRQGKFATVFSMQPNSGQLRKLSDLVEDLKVRPIIDTIVPLSKAVEAMNELQEGHTVGKIGVRIE